MMTGEPRMKLMQEVVDDVTVVEAHGRLDSTTAQQFGDRLIASSRLAEARSWSI
jgi:hypothetical protein